MKSVNMNSNFEASRLADQIRRAFEGEAWHGDSLEELLADVAAARASAHPIKSAHSIWELVLHISAWDNAVIRRISGTAVELSDKENFPKVSATSAAAWKRTVEAAKQTHQTLVAAVDSFPDERLRDKVAGKKEPYYDFYY